MEQTRNTCVIKFETSLGGTKNVRINDPRPGLTANEVDAAARQLTTFYMFEPEIGGLVDILGAEVVRVTKSVVI